MNNTRDYKLYFNLYNDKLASLNDSLGFISEKRKYKPADNILNESEKRLILKRIAAVKGLNEINTNDFEETIDILFEDKQELVSILQSYFVELKPSVFKQHLRTFLETVFDKASTDAHIDLSTSAFKKMAKSWALPYNGNHTGAELYLKKLYVNREFLFKKSLDDSYMPTVPVTEKDAYGFDKLSFAELQAAFMPSLFYTLNEDQVKSLSQALVTKYLEAQNVDTCKVDFAYIKRSSSNNIYGEYHPNKGVIEINNKFVTGFNSAKNDYNSVFPIKLMSTLIHNARVRAQYANLNNSNLDIRSELVSQAILRPTCTEYMTKDKTKKESYFAEYISTADELDARETELEAIAYLMATQKNQGAESEDILRLAAYYNTIVEKERANSKHDIKEEYKTLFPHLYNNDTFNFNESKGIRKEIDVYNDQTLKILTSFPTLFKDYNAPILDY